MCHICIERGGKKGEERRGKKREGTGSSKCDQMLTFGESGQMVENFFTILVASLLSHEGT